MIQKARLSKSQCGPLMVTSSQVALSSCRNFSVRALALQSARHTAHRPPAALTATLCDQWAARGVQWHCELGGEEEQSKYCDGPDAVAGYASVSHVSQHNHSPLHG